MNAPDVLSCSIVRLDAWVRAHSGQLQSSVMLDRAIAQCIQATAVGCCRTAEYMSPELLHEDDGKKAAPMYDPRATDVWAAGEHALHCESKYVLRV